LKPGKLRVAKADRDEISRGELRYPGNISSKELTLHIQGGNCSMTWRGSTTVSDRILACLPYLLPLIESLIFGYFFISQFPIIGLLIAPLFPIASVYTSITGGIPFGGLIIFFMLYFVVVRNFRVPHFIRFNTMQALLVGIAVSLCGVVLQLFNPVLGRGILIQTAYNVIFLGVLAIFVYSVFQSLMGRYAEIPTISDAVYMHVRD